MKKLLLCAVVLMATTHMEAVRYGKRTGTQLIKSVQDFCNSVQDTYEDSFDAIKTVDNRKASKSEKRSAERTLLKKAQSIKLKFTFLSNLFALEENEALKDHPLVAYIDLLNACVAKSKKYIIRLEKLKKDAGRELKSKKSSKDDKAIFEKLIQNSDKLLKEVKEQKEKLLDLDEMIKNTDEFRDDKKSYGNTMRIVKLNKTIRDNSNHIILHGCHCNCWTCWFNC